MKGANGFDTEWLAVQIKSGKSIISGHAAHKSEPKADIPRKPTVPAADLEPDPCDAAPGPDATQAIDTPVCVSVHCARKRLADIDGISVKAMLDGLVMAGVLEDDGPEIVTGITVTQSRAGRKDGR